MRERSRWLTLAMIIGAALALLAFAACGGDDDDDSGGTNTAAPTQSGGDGGNGDGTPTETPDGGDNGDDEDPFASLDELTQDLDQVTGKITYEIDTDGDVSTMTLYSNPPNTRYDTTDDSGVTAILITTSEATYSCSSDTETCFSFPSDGTGGLGGLGFLSGFFGAGAVGVYVAAAEAAGFDVDTSSGSYAGQDADCFSWTDPEDSASSVKFCFGSNGVMLYEEIKDANSSTTITATEYSSSTSDSDFEPPYDVTTLGG